MVKQRVAEPTVGQVRPSCDGHPFAPVFARALTAFFSERGVGGVGVRW